MNIKRDILWRVYLSFALVCVLAFAVVFKIINTQSVKGKYWKDKADSLSLKMMDIPPIRGNIYACDGSLLATSIPIYVVRMDACKETISKADFYAGIDSLAFCLANFFKDKSTEKYKHEMVSARRIGLRSYLIHRNVNHTELNVLRTFPILRLGRYRGGLIIDPESKRIQPFSFAQRTIGYKNINNPNHKILVGMEGSYDHYLNGDTGKRLMQKVSGGNWIPVKDENELEPKDGKDIITTIDVNIQDFTTKALQNTLIEHDAHHGCAVVMEVKTGQIKAIANLSRIGEGNYIEDYNYALGESTEPGSTFKLATVLAMLEAGGITPNTMLNTEGGEKDFFGRPMKDSKKGGYGIITLKKAFAYSSNVAISSAAYNVFAKNPGKFSEYLYNLKLNKPMGIDISGEGKPVVKNPGNASWSRTTLPWMSIGYEVKLTPLQILTLYNAVANNGVMVKPYFVSEIRSVGKPVQQFGTQVISEKICSNNTLKAVQEMLELVIQEKNGTGEKIKSPLYRIAGKTGTAQVANEMGSYAEQHLYQSSFCGYFPADKPRYSIVVVANSPSKGSYYGGYVAAPVFKEIADKIYANTESTQTYLATNKTKEKKTAPLPASVYSGDLNKLLAEAILPNQNIEQNNEWLKVKYDHKNLNVDAYSVTVETVPDVTGMLLSDAVYVLENAGLKVRFKGKGKVKFQSKTSGTSLIKNEVIELVLN